MALLSNHHHTNLFLSIATLFLKSFCFHHYCVTAYCVELTENFVAQRVCSFVPKACCVALRAYCSVPLLALAAGQKACFAVARKACAARPVACFAADAHCSWNLLQAFLFQKRCAADLCAEQASFVHARVSEVFSCGRMKVPSLLACDFPPFCSYGCVMHHLCECQSYYVCFPRFPVVLTMSDPV